MRVRAGIQEERLTDFVNYSSDCRTADMGVAESASSRAKETNNDHDIDEPEHSHVQLCKRKVEERNACICSI